MDRPVILNVHDDPAAGVRSCVADPDPSLHEWIESKREAKGPGYDPNTSLRWVCARCLLFTFRIEKPSPSVLDRKKMTCHERIVNQIVSE